MTTDPQAELKPCPHPNGCDGEPEVFLSDSVKGSFYVSCPKCDICGPRSKDKSEAIALWNRREPSHYDSEQAKAVAARAESDMQALKAENARLKMEAAEHDSYFAGIELCCDSLLQSGRVLDKRLAETEARLKSVRALLSELHSACETADEGDFYIGSGLHESIRRELTQEPK